MTGVKPTGNSVPVIVVVGSINHDSVIRCAHLPQPGETVQGHDYDAGLGGKGANQAVAAAQAGGRVAMVGAVGRDAAGSSLLTELARYGVATEHVTTVDGATGVAHVHVEHSGENHIVIHAGANGRVSELSARQRTAVGSADAVLLQLEVPMEVVYSTAKMSHAAGVPVILNPAPAAPLPEGLLDYIDVLILNRTELEVLSGIADLEEAVRSLSRYRLHVIATLGAEGSLWAGPDGNLIRTAAAQVPVVDTTGAGDCFAGAFAVAWARGGDLRQAIVEATAAAGLSVQRAGAANSMPSEAQIQSALRGERVL